ncbi:uncharacterized protein LOC112878198 [Panicum hallii]|uniref:uncharacterized protein LOC112878198 n=1 Tax=Panicum hallii TaxID=206008 RepID=UPI000DF4EA6B|nr:uncharacterized protein LOC112878198 [Panicum hallii]
MLAELGRAAGSAQPAPSAHEAGGSLARCSLAAGGPHPQAAERAHASGAARPAALSRTPAELARAAGSAQPAASAREADGSLARYSPTRPASLTRPLRSLPTRPARPAELADAASSAWHAALPRTPAELADAAGSELPRTWLPASHAAPTHGRGWPNSLQRSSIPPYGTSIQSQRMSI